MKNTFSGEQFIQDRAVNILDGRDMCQSVYKDYLKGKRRTKFWGGRVKIVNVLYMYYTSGVISRVWVGF